ncbi:arrestin domain-containing protein 5 [Alligator mississippiensis]|uniref:arrestin domain-containing protein 5 n=1 Tax=Alligator mississippiensis TaxID=8496 RepID=UPI00287752A5|nr:arrestin domain-containing protein 5 [Alligator mississippiensis]
MSVVKSIEIVVPEDKVYLAGSNVDGQVVLSLNNTLINPVVKVELVGRGYLQWNEDVGADKDYSRDVVCNNKADYINKTKTFKIEGNWLDSGTHTFDFHFTLSTRLPSTFTSRIGYVSYFLQASCSSRELILAKKKKYLLVQGTSSIRKDRLQSKDPFVVEVDKVVVYHCCFQQGRVVLRISLVKNIFCPSENVTFTTEIDNQTGKSIKRVVFTLYSNVLYMGFTARSEPRTLEDRNVLLRLEPRMEAMPFEVTRITNIMALPSLLPVSCVSLANEIMEIRYELVGTLYLPWSMSSVVARVPVLIGTIPTADPEESGSGAHPNP